LTRLADVMGEPGAAVRSARVALVVAVPLLRDGLASLIAEDDSIEVVARAARCDGVDIDGLDAAVVYLDELSVLRTPAFATLREAPELRLIGVHDNLPARSVELAQTNGFSVLVDINAGHSAIVDAVTGRRVHTLRRWEPPRIGVAQLTERERAVLSRVASGASSREIASLLMISVHTVENYKQRVFRKLGVANQAQAVAIAFRHGLLGPSRDRVW
jgi:DNA-binding NarL/FixJ family response regulator